jgi:hypothetical protein
MLVDAIVCRAFGPRLRVLANKSLEYEIRLNICFIIK